MSRPSSPKSLVCEEVFDERSQPSEDEIREFAVRIGIDPDAEAHLLPLAREGLLKPLPKNWKPVYDRKSKNYYYFNFKTNQTSWEHPLDNKFREIVKKSRSESISSAGEEDSKTSIKEELKSFEEAGTSVVFEPDNTSSLRDNQMDLSSGTPVLKSALSPLRSLRKENQENSSLRKGRSRPFSVKGDHLKPVFTPKPLFTQNSNESSMSIDRSKLRSSKPIWDDLSSYLDDNDDDDDTNEKLKGIARDRSGGDGKYLSSLDYNFHDQDKNIDNPGSSVIGRFTVDRVRKIDIDSQTKRLDSDGVDSERRSSERFLKTGYGQPEFTLSGGGSIFLKSNKKKSEDGEGSKLVTSPKVRSDSFSDIDLKLKSLDTDSKEPLMRSLKSSMRSLTASPTASTSSTRSILRTPQAEKRLWDVDPLHMSVSEKALWKQQELEEEKKSVRFNLDKELNISFKLSDSDSDTSSEGVQVDEDIDWNSNASEDLAMEFKQLQKDTSKTEKATKSHVSPLEEWAKETWFSRKSTLTDKTEGDPKASLSLLSSASLGGLASPKGRQPQNESKLTNEQRLQETIQSASNLSWQNNDGASSFHRQDDPEKEKKDSVPFKPITSKFSQSLPTEDNLHVSDIDNLLINSSLRSSLSQSVSHEHEPTESEISLAASLTDKLKGLSRKDLDSPESSSSKDIRARERAFRDWNVKLSDGEMYRPPLSRQQSQQQLQQIKQQMQEPVKAVERDRALREWNVTDSLGDSLPAPNTSISIPNALELTSVPPENREGDNMAENSTEKESVPTQDFLPPGSNSKSVTNSTDFQTARREFEDKLKVGIEELKTNYDMLLKEKEIELKKKFEEDQQEIVNDFKEKLKMKIEEESKSNEIRFKEVVSQIERDSDIRLKQLKEQLEHRQNCASQKILEQHQQALAAQEVENQAAMLRFREQHSAEMKSLREQFQREEEQARREQQDRILNLREDRDGKRSRDTTDHLRSIEKLRCEKRLVEDKYRTLKEKYIKLKGEMKANVEKNKEHKQKESHQHDDKPKHTQTTTVEPEASTSQQQSDRSSETESRPKTMSAGSSGTSTSLGFQKFQSQSQPQEQLNQVLDPPSPAPNSGPTGLGKDNNNESNDPNVPFLGRSFSNPPFHEKNLNPNRNGMDPPHTQWCNFAHIKTVENNGNVPLESHYYRNTQDFKVKSNEASPLEALRNQLKTLDELEEQFPVSSVTDAYLPYPFSDRGCKELESAELEFFRHRIHLERDMIRQARNSLQVQQSEYRSRIHNFQQRQSAASSLPSTTLSQMAKEEQELSEMEVKIRRTQNILGEKMIHLRQLENSLNRITDPSLRSEVSGRRTNNVLEPRYVEHARVKQHRRWDWKNGGNVLGTEEVSDEMSSDSGGSSGFSSTEYTSDNALGSLLSRTGSGNRFKRTSDNTADINVSLHNLNAEISEIWNVLCRQRAAAGLGPPPLLSAQPATWVNPASTQFTSNLSSSRAGSPLSVPSMPKVTSDKNSSLIERTNNLRQWLHKAKMSATLPTPSSSKDKNEVSF